MHFRRPAIFFILTILVSWCADARDWPEIPKSDWEISSFADFPNAAAIILDRKGEFHFDKNSRSSYLDVYTRIKILTAEGLDYGSIQLDSSDYMRVKELEGRTHLPGNKIVNLPSEAKFTKEYSDYYGTSIVSCALPEVIKGAIIEYRYRTYFDSIFYPRAWYFQTEIPGMNLGQLGWKKVDGRIPAIRFDALVSKSRFLRKGKQYRMQLSYLETLPGPRELVDRTEPVVLLPGVNISQWKIALAEGICRPEIEVSDFSNSIGSIENTSDDAEPGQIVLRHGISVRSAWIGVESMGHLREFAVAEDQSSRPVLRWSCDD